MESILPFLMNHWLLAGAFIITLGLLIATYHSNSVGGIRLLTPDMLVNAMNHEKVCILDVRDKALFKTSHILHAVNLPLAELGDNLKKVEKYKTKWIITVADQESNAIKAAKLLHQHGIKTASALRGGLHAWRDQQLPLVAKK